MAPPLEPIRMEPQSIYQKYLRDEYEKRRGRNLAYSLRAFARDLEIPSPKLSQYLNGACGISSPKATHLAKMLNLGVTETELFTCSAEAAHARTSLARAHAKTRLRELMTSTFSEINLEKFSLIRDWHHLAILELTELEQFVSNSTWISNALGVPLESVEEALRRLERLGLLTCSSRRWRQTEKDLETPPDYTSRAVRDYHHQMLRLVDERFESVDVQRREMGSVIVSVDQALLPDLKKAIRKFQREIAKISDASLKKNSLYALNVQLMPLIEGVSP